jgi:hypothetical protein
MVERVMNADALQTFISNTFHSAKVLVREHNHVVTIKAIGEENSDGTSGLRGLLSDCPEMSVDAFLKRKHRDRELEL